MFEALVFPIYEGGIEIASRIWSKGAPHVDDPHLYFNLSHSIELGRKERFDVTSGYFPTFPLGGEKLARPYLWLTAKGDIAAQRDIYFSFRPLFFTDRWPIEKRKETRAEKIKNYSLLHSFSKSIKTYRLRCSSTLVEFSWDRTDCIFVSFPFFLFSFFHRWTKFFDRSFFRYVNSKSLNLKIQ